VIGQSHRAPSLRAKISAAEPTSFIHAGGAELAVKRWGVGPPVLCLHAVGHGSGDFAALAERIGDRYEVIAVDWPGHGRSLADSQPVRSARFAEIALAVCDTLALQRPIVIGNSIGGAAAITAAVASPGRFRGLVLCNAGGLAPVDLLARTVVGWMAGFFQAGARGAPWYPAAFAAYYHTFVLTRKPAHAQRDRIIAASRELAPLLADAWRGFGQPDADLRGQVEQITIPVWLAWAKGDQFASWGRAKKACRRFSNHEIMLFAGSHAPFLEDPDEFAEKFTKFAQQLKA